jgi:hypothetical protein
MFPELVAMIEAMCEFMLALDDCDQAKIDVARDELEAARAALRVAAGGGL